MCLLIFKSAASSVKPAWIKEGWRCNAHGAGLAWVENGEVQIKKGYMKLEDLEADIPLIAGKPAIIHFRIASVGNKTADNCHPFDAGGEWAMGHNGTIPNMTTVGEESDTSAFARDVLQPILDADKSAIFDTKIQKELEAKIPGSKMVLLNPLGQRVILNEHLGHWVEGVWYSNRSYVLPLRSVQGSWSSSSKWEKYKSFYYEMFERKAREAKFPQKKSKAQRKAEKKARRLLGKDGSTTNSSTSNTKDTTGSGPDSFLPFDPKIPSSGIPDGIKLSDYEFFGNIWRKRKDQEVVESDWEVVGRWVQQRRRNRSVRGLFSGGRFIECNSSGKCQECGNEFPNDGEAFFDTEASTSEAWSGLVCRDCACEILTGEQEDIDDRQEGCLYEQEQIELERAEEERLMGVTAHEVR